MSYKKDFIYKNYLLLGEKCNRVLAAIINLVALGVGAVLAQKESKIFRRSLTKRF